MSTSASERETVKVTGVFVQYRDVEEDFAGQKREVVRTAFAGEEVEMPAQEAKRLRSFGGMVGEVDVAGAIARALNPSDNVREGLTTVPTPVTVSPPSLGVAPAGGDEALTAGDTGTEPLMPLPGATAAAPAPAVPEFDARGKSLDDTAAWLRESNPNGPATVAAAHDDSEAAETLLEAERLVRGQDPRVTVERPLQDIIDRGNA